MSDECSKCGYPNDGGIEFCSVAHPVPASSEPRRSHRPEPDYVAEQRARQASSEPRPENPYRVENPDKSTDCARYIEEAWDEGFASRQPEIDRLEAERDEATRQREQAATSRNVIAEQRDKAIDRLVRLEREGEHLARPAAEKLVSLTREGEEWAAEQRQTIHDLGRVKAAEGRRLSRLEDALKHLREFVQDGEVRRIIDAALDGEDWDA